MFKCIFILLKTKILSVGTCKLRRRGIKYKKNICKDFEENYFLKLSRNNFYVRQAGKKGNLQYDTKKFRESLFWRNKPKCKKKVKM